METLGSSRERQLSLSHSEEEEAKSSCWSSMCTVLGVGDAWEQGDQLVSASAQPCRIRQASGCFCAPGRQGGPITMADMCPGSSPAQGFVDSFLKPVLKTGVQDF